MLAKLVSLDRAKIAVARLVDEEIDPVVVIELLPRISEPVRVAPFAERDHVSVALEAYTFFQVDLLAPMSNALLLEGSKLVPRLVVEPGCSVKLLFTLTKFVSLDRA
jgi:hypothetical protein